MLHAKNFTQDELINYFNEGKLYFLCYNSFYTLRLSQNAGFYFLENRYLKNYSKDKMPYTKKGRFHAFTFENVKKLSFIEGIENLTA